MLSGAESKIISSFEDGGSQSIVAYCYSTVSKHFIARQTYTTHFLDREFCNGCPCGCGRGSSPRWSSARDVDPAGPGCDGCFRLPFCSDHFRCLLWPAQRDRHACGNRLHARI